MDLNILYNHIYQIDILKKYFLYSNEPLFNNTVEILGKVKYGLYIHFCVEDKMNLNKKLFNLESFLHLFNEDEFATAKSLSSYIEVIEGSFISIDFDNVNFDKLKDEYILDPWEATKQWHEASEMTNILYNNMIIMLIVKLNNFIHDIIPYLVNKYPSDYLDYLNGIKPINYNTPFSKSLLSTKSKDKVEYRNLIENITKDIQENTKFKDLHEILKVANINISKKNYPFDELNLLYKQRNIIVHNDGLVNNQFLKAAKKITTKNFKINDSLRAEYEEILNYFNACKIFIYKLFIKLIENATEIDINKDALMNIKFDIISDCLYNIERMIRNPINHDLNYKDIKLDLINKINHWISEKNLSSLDDIKNEINKFNFPDTDSFKIVVNFLDDLKEFNQIF